MTNEPERLGSAVERFLEERPHLRDLAAALPQDEPAPTRETEEEAHVRAQARRAIYWARWQEQVPPMFQGASMADLDPEQRASWPGEGPEWPQGALNVVLAGPVGTGKTHAAYAIGNALARSGAWVQAATVVDLLAAFRPEGDPSLAKAAQESHVLILDDLGAGKATEWAVETMTSLLDRRVREERRTLVTTNVPEPDLEATWGGRFMDRLRYRRVVGVFRGESRRVAAW